MKKGVLTTSSIVKKLSERMNISKKQAELLYDNFIDTFDMVANYTDALAIRVTHLGVLYLDERGLFLKEKELKKRLSHSTHKRNQLKLEEQLHWLGKKKIYFKQQCKIKGKKFANKFNSILNNIIMYSRLSRTEIANKQNEYKKIKENK